MKSVSTRSIIHLDRSGELAFQKKVSVYESHNVESQIPELSADLAALKTHLASVIAQYPFTLKKGEKAEKGSISSRPCRDAV
ncbi:hypothetical protein OXX59_004578, partial [Metschnikowia pulcherrima]